MNYYRLDNHIYFSFIYHKHLALHKHNKVGGIEKEICSSATQTSAQNPLKEPQLRNPGSHAPHKPHTFSLLPSAPQNKTVLTPKRALR